MVNLGAQPWRVLIVDDDEDDYLLTREMLDQAQGRKIHLEWAPDYAAGQQRLTDTLFDAVLVDYDLGPHTGTELIAEFSERGYPAPLILYTGRGTYAVDLEAMAAGATIYLTKNETTPLLLERSIRYAIERKQIETELRATTERLAANSASLANELAERERVEQMLEASRAEAVHERNRLQAVMDALPVGVAIVDARGGQIQANQAYEKIWSGPRPAVHSVGDYAAYQAWWADTGEPLQPEEWASARAVQNGETITGQLLQIRRFDGSRAFVMNSGAPVFDSQGQIVGSAVAIMDITGLKNAENALRESEHKFSLIFEKAAFAAALLKIPDGILADVNEAWVNMIGYSSEEAIGKSLFELEIAPQEETRNRILPVIQEGRAVRNLEVPLRTKSGEWRDFSLNVDLLQIAGETYLLATGRDITERLQAARALLQANERLQSQAQELETQTGELLAANHLLQAREEELQLIMDATPALISYLDADYRYRRVNQGYERWFGCTSGEVQGKYVWEVLGERAFQAVRPHLDRALRGEEVTYEMKTPYREGGTRWTRTTLTPDRDPADRVRGLVGHVIDIEEVKQAEAILRQSEQQQRTLAETLEVELARLAAAFDHLPVSVGIGDPNGTTLSLNQAGLELHGFKSQEEMFAQLGEYVHSFELRYPDGRAMPVEEWPASRAQRGEFVHDYELILRNNSSGSERPVCYSVEPVLNSRGETALIVYLMQDLSEQKKIEQRLLEDQSRLEEVFAAIPSPILEFDAEGRPVWMNRAAAQAIGPGALSLSEEEIIARLQFRNLDGSPVELEALPIPRILRGELTAGDLYRIKTVDEIERVISVYAAPISRGADHLTGAVALGCDLSALKQAEAELHASQSCTQEILDSIQDGFWVLDAEWRFIFINSRAAQTVGVQPADLAGKNLWDTFPILFDTEVERQYRMTMADRLPRQFESAGLFRPGTYLVSVYPFSAGISVYWQDITERKRVEEALRESERRFSALAEALPEVVWTADADGEIEWFNQRWYEYTGEPQGSGEGWSWDRVSYPDDMPRTLERWAEARQAGGLYQNEIRVRRHDGQYRWFLVRAWPVKDAEGNVLRWVGTDTDVEDIKAAEQALHQIRIDLDRAQEVGQTGSWRLDFRTNILAWSDQNYRIFGVAKGTPMTYESFLELVHPDDRQFLVGRWKACLAGEPYDIEHRAIVNGCMKWLREKAYLEFDEAGELRSGFGITQDITERKLTEQALRESEEKFRGAVANAAIGFAMTAPDGNFIDANPAFCSLTGYSIDELCQIRFSDLIYPEDREANLTLTDRMLAGEIPDFVIENRYVCKAGEPVWVRKSVSLERDPEGAPRWIIVLVEDITQRQEAEAALLAYTEKLQRSNQALEDFAFIASHDLHEPLRKVQVFGNLLKSGYSQALDAQGQDYIERMQKAAERMQSMIDGLLAYSRIATQGQPFSAVDLQQVMGEVLSDLEARLMQTGGRVEVGPLPVIQADSLQIRQLLQNLVGNALKFHRPGIPPLVKVSSALAPENRITLSVADNGIGFDLQYADRIFKPFQRLHGKSDFEGTGMGLAICQRIVERHGGSITVTSQPGEGTTFIVTINGW